MSADFVDLVRYYLAAALAMLIATIGLEIIHVSPWWIGIPLAFVVVIATVVTFAMFFLSSLNLTRILRGIRDG